MEIFILVHIFKTKKPIFNCNTSMCRYGHTLHFVYWHRKRQTCLWGRYDQKTENCDTFSVIVAMCCNQSSIVIPLCVDLATYYISFIDTEDVWRMHEDVMTRKLKIPLSFWLVLPLSAVWTTVWSIFPALHVQLLFVCHFLFKINFEVVKNKRSESFYSCLQL
jgi:hypothetical protein